MIVNIKMSHEQTSLLVDLGLFIKVTFKRQVHSSFFHSWHCQLLVHMTNKPSSFFFFGNTWQHSTWEHRVWRVCSTILMWELNIFNESVWWQDGWAVKLALLTTRLGEVDPLGNQLDVGQDEQNNKQSTYMHRGWWCLKSLDRKDLLREWTRICWKGFCKSIKIMELILYFVLHS